MVLDGADEYPRQAILRRLSGEPPPVDVEGTEVPEVAEKTAETTRVDRLLQEIQQRAEQAPDVYPFDIDDGVVVRAAKAGAGCYVFMLWLSREDAPFRKTSVGRDEVERPWDELAQAALEVLVGPHGDSRLFAQRYGLAEPTDEIRPTGFPEAIEWLRGHLKLIKGQEPPTGVETDDSDEDQDTPARTYNDGGADVIAWRHFRDGRAGFPIVIAQCTIQLKWRNKSRDVSLELWRSWIDFPARPQKALVIPFAPTIDARLWRDRTRQAGMLLDRLRVSELLGHMDEERLSSFSAPREAWALKDIAGWIERAMTPRSPEEPRAAKSA